MKLNWKCYAAATMLAGSISGRAMGAAFVDVSILGNDGSSTGTFTSSVQASPGDTVYYQVVVEMAPIGTVNTSSGNRTITSLTPGTDGVSAISYNLADSGVTWNTDNALVGTWVDGGGHTPGTVAPSTGITSADAAINTVNGDLRLGVASTNTPGNALVETGSFVVGSSSSSVIGTYDSFQGSFKYNGNTALNINSSDPAGFSNFSSLSVNVASTPEPASLGLLAITGAGLLARRRRRMA